MTTKTIIMTRPHTNRQMDMITFSGNVVAFCGRRFGKTDGYVQRIYWQAEKKAKTTKRQLLYWWVGLSWRSASMKRAWKETVAIARQILSAAGLKEREHINRSAHEIRIPGLCDIWFRTADNPSSLAGEGIDGAVLDEFSLMQEIVWTEYIEATLLDYGGWVAFSGVPKGNNWAANLWRSASGRDGWLQIHATSYDNPHINKDKIDEIKSNSTERLFNQEYLAQITSDAGDVFRRVVEAATAKPQSKAIDKHYYAIGVDWAKSSDYTVITVLDTTTSELVYIDRFNQIDYQLQLKRLQLIHDKFPGALIVPERNSIGEPLAEQLVRTNMRIYADADKKPGFYTTLKSKAYIIEALSLAFERGEIKIVPDDILINELQSYQQERLPAGGYRFNAPQGQHDDCVMSLALAWTQAHKARDMVLF